MINITDTLAKHAEWLADPKTGKRADLRGANLRGANLRGANLRGANLSDADLRGANLSDADLRGANLHGANLRDANLSDADLRGATLSDANLSDANLSGANLSGANLRYTDLCGANLRYTDLCGAHLSGANLSGANISHCAAIISVCLTNYVMCAYQHDGHTYLSAGCRRHLTLAEARTHWADKNRFTWTVKTPEYGARQRAMIEFLAQQAAALGWPV